MHGSGGGITHTHTHKQPKQTRVETIKGKLPSGACSVGVWVKNVEDFTANPPCGCVQCSVRHANRVALERKYASKQLTVCRLLATGKKGNGLQHIIHERFFVFFFCFV